MLTKAHVGSMGLNGDKVGIEYIRLDESWTMVCM